MKRPFRGLLCRVNFRHKTQIERHSRGLPLKTYPVQRRSTEVSYGETTSIDLQWRVLRLLQWKVDLQRSSWWRSPPDVFQFFFYTEKTFFSNHERPSRGPLYRKDLSKGFYGEKISDLSRKTLKRSSTQREREVPTTSLMERKSPEDFLVENGSISLSCKKDFQTSSREKIP